MRLKAAFLFSGLLLLGCAAPKVYEQDPIFAATIAEYKHLFNAPIYYDIVFVDSLPEPAVGICYIGLPNNRVRISREAFATFNDCEKEELLFHEMSHCSFGIQHRDVLKSDGMPDSIMASRMFHGTHYCAHREEYLEQLRSMIYR